MKLLFVCTGNTCRSPMAEALAAREGGWQARSGGVAALAGDRASAHAVDVMGEVGLDISDHRSAPVTEAEMVWADLVLTMTEGHRKILIGQFPEHGHKIHTLCEYADCASGDIADPFGQDITAYRHARNQIAAAVASLVQKREGLENQMSESIRLAIACDHAGVSLKRDLIAWLKGQDYEVVDLGCDCSGSVDYPDYAEKVARSVARGDSSLGILICGTGIGMAIAANKVEGIRAAVCSDTFSARSAREHNNANILCLGQRVVGPGLAVDIVSAWLGASFGGGRHAGRIAKITALERGE